MANQAFFKSNALEQAAKSAREDMKLYTTVRVATYTRELGGVQLVPVQPKSGAVTPKRSTNKR